ncbi:MAG: Ig-like domain-containing protein [Bacteroidales bacterium]|nr:Ig-like domain-containing protein [Bacteroidales bacterium]
MSCNKEKLITLTESSATLHHGETYQINAECENPILFSSENEYHAKVSSSGLVTANYIGNTTITLQSENWM